MFQNISEILPSDSELSKKLETALENFLNDSEPCLLNFDEPVDLRKVAAKLNLLPMMIDWEGYYGIKLSGEIVFVNVFNGEPYDFKPENDSRICRIVLYRGSKKYPELSEFMSKRPFDAEDCRNCGGTGIEPTNKKLGFKEERIACWCGGLGWLPKGEPQLF